jgi:2-dehydro-3-deoxyphosphooctonate aldolase (KDO 8-P synthase)
MRHISREIAVGDGIKLGGRGPLFLIAGPCVLESEAGALTAAVAVRDICRRLGVPFVFKASFDKANRLSRESFRGPGLEQGLEILRAVKAEAGVPVLSDIHEAGQAEKAAEVLDIIQIPAFLCRQTDLVTAAARTGRAVNIKKGQFLAPEDMRHILDKALAAGNENILLTERGTSFGYHNLVVDARSIPIMKAWGRPVVMDASHSAQRPGGEGGRSGGDAGFIPLLAKVGVVAGADGVFIEVHENPADALSDRANSLRLADLEGLLRELLRLRAAEADGA